MLRGWFIWGAGALFFAYAFFHRVAPSVMFDHLMRDFMVSAAVLGNLSACYFYAYAGMQIPAGLILDRWGPRLLLAVAALVCALASPIVTRTRPGVGHAGADRHRALGRTPRLRRSGSPSSSSALPWPASKARGHLFSRPHSPE